MLQSQKVFRKLINEKKSIRQKPKLDILRTLGSLKHAARGPHAAREHQ